MGISQAMFTGVTGLSVNSDNMSVIANNIANTNAKGFKYDRAEFEDLLSVDLGGGAQLGRGARISDVKTIFTQGGLAVTDNLTDMAIQGNGFFVVKNTNTEVQESGGSFFTRVGSFHFNKDGFLSDNVGGRVQGYMADANGYQKAELSDVRVLTNNLAPAATKKIAVNVNLDSRDENIEDPFDVNDAERTSNFSNTFTVYDSQGRGHQCTIYYRRGELDDEGTEWTWHATVNGAEVEDGGGDALREFANGTMKFDRLGNLLREETFESELNFAGGALPGQVLEFDFGQSLEEGGNGMGATSSTASRSITVFHSQDGYEAGNLKSLKVELDGKVMGIYTNGTQKMLGAIAMATFENNDGLQKAGRNQFIQTMSSGPAKIGNAQTGTRGSIYASSLEESNVDLAGQFVNMIMTQRAFQANSRSITTTDGLIEEVVNLKR